MGSFFAKIQRALGKTFCFLYSALLIMCAFAFPGLISIGVWDNSDKGILTFAFFLSLTCGILLLAAGLHDSDRDGRAAAKPPRFFTVNEDGKIILTEISAPPPLDCKEIRRADGKVDISMEIHSKEQALEVLAALAVMYDKGDISADDYHCNVHKIREHFNL